MSNEAQQQAGNFVDNAAKTAHDAIDKVGKKVSAYGECAEDCGCKVKEFVTARPMSALALTLGVGLLIGMAVSRRS